MMNLKTNKLPAISRYRLQVGFVATDGAIITQTHCGNDWNSIALWRDGYRRMQGVFRVVIYDNQEMTLIYEASKKLLDAVSGTGDK